MSQCARALRVGILGVLASGTWAEYKVDSSPPSATGGRHHDGFFAVGRVSYSMAADGSVENWPTPVVNGVLDDRRIGGLRIPR